MIIWERPQIIYGGKATVRGSNLKDGEAVGKIFLFLMQEEICFAKWQSKFEPDSDYTNVRELTIQNTNEVAWEHYTAMRDISDLTLKDGNYNVEDVMKSIMDTYETRYNEIVKEHENGDREVSYELTGKRSLTLDEDLAGLDEAFKMRLANLEGYITCQQTNKAFENADSSWYFRRNSPQNEVKTQDKAQMFDTKYQKTAVSIMEQAKEKFW